MNSFTLEHEFSVFIENQLLLYSSIALPIFPSPLIMYSHWCSWAWCETAGWKAQCYTSPLTFALSSSVALTHHPGEFEPKSVLGDRRVNLKPLCCETICLPFPATTYQLGIALAAARVGRELGDKNQQWFTGMVVHQQCTQITSLVPLWVTTELLQDAGTAVGSI